MVHNGHEDLKSSKRLWNCQFQSLRFKCRRSCILVSRCTTSCVSVCLRYFNWICVYLSGVQRLWDSHWVNVSMEISAERLRDRRLQGITVSVFNRLKFKTWNFKVEVPLYLYNKPKFNGHPLDKPLKLYNQFLNFFHVAPDPTRNEYILQKEACPL